MSRYSNFDVDPKSRLNFETICLTCKTYDFVHYTIIFNAFIFCQLFNEFNARNLGDDPNVLRGLSANPIFIGVIVVTILLQVRFFWQPCLIFQQGGN